MAKSRPEDWAWIGNKRTLSEEQVNCDGIYSGGVNKRNVMLDGDRLGESQSSLEASPKRTSLRKPHE